MSCNPLIVKAFRRTGALVVLGLLAGCPKPPPPTPEPPLALFTATPSVGLAPLSVAFGDTSPPGTSPITLWQWDFGDGSTAATQNPTHVYTTIGTYNVTLTIATVVGVSHLTRTNFITVRNASPPRPNFTVDFRSGPAPLTVNFTDSSDAGTNPITSWLWDFGDGATSKNQNPTHIFTKLGYFDITLTATSATGPGTVVRGAYITATGKDLAFGGAGVDRAFGLTLMDDGRYVLVGDSLDPAGTTRSLSIVTTDIHGNLGSQQNFTGLGDESASAVVPTHDGGLFVSGTFTATDGTNITNALLFRTDTAGSRLWSRILGTPSLETAAALALTVDDGAVIAGSSAPDAVTGSQAWAARFDSEGGLVWSYAYGPGKFQGVLAKGSGFVFCGTTENGEDARIVRVGGDGSVAWDTTLGGDGRQNAASVAALPNGGYVVAGISSPYDGGGDAWVAVVDALGAPGWVYQYPGGGPSRANAVIVRADGGITFAGSVKSSTAALDDAFLVSLSGTGSKQWEQRYGGANSDRAYALIAEGDGGYALAGSTESFGTTGTNMYLVKTNANGVQQNFPIAGR